jgi:hypothetical protein
MTDQTDAPLACFSATCKAGLRALPLMQGSRRRFEVAFVSGANIAIHGGQHMQ